MDRRDLTEENINDKIKWRLGCGKGKQNMLYKVTGEYVRIINIVF